MFIGAVSVTVVGALLGAFLLPTVTDAGNFTNPLEDQKHRPHITIRESPHDRTIGWIVNKRAGDIGQLPHDITSDGAWETWVQQYGAVQVAPQRLYLKLQGGSAKAVLIDRLEVTVLKRHPAIAGTHVFVPGGGDGVPTRMFRVNLDESDHPKVVPIERKIENTESENSSVWEDVPEEMGPVSVSETELERFAIIAETSSCYCEWKAKLYWAVNDFSGETVIDDRGKPFRTTSHSGRTDVKPLSE